MNVRKIVPEQDFPVIADWWVKHKVCIPLPMPLLPEGYIISAAGVDIAAGFLYLDANGKWAMIEWMTTNPAMAYSRTLVEAWKELAAHIENVARGRGCQSVISMVTPGTGEERLFRKCGYITSEGPAHKMYGKLLVKEGA